MTDLPAAYIRVTEQVERYLKAHTAIGVNEDEIPNFRGNVPCKSPTPNVRVCTAKYPTFFSITSVPNSTQILTETQGVCIQQDTSHHSPKKVAYLVPLIHWLISKVTSFIQHLCRMSTPQSLYHKTLYLLFRAYTQQDMHASCGVHEKVGHQGRGITIKSFRENGSWVVGGSAAVSQCITKCVTCRGLHKSRQIQKMSDLW